jgi:hypothetical protein
MNQSYDHIIEEIIDIMNIMDTLISIIYEMINIGYEGMIDTLYDNNSKDD